MTKLRVLVLVLSFPDFTGICIPYKKYALSFFMRCLLCLDCLSLKTLKSKVYISNLTVDILQILDLKINEKNFNAKIVQVLQYCDIY
jgi:hypothetical protein